MYYRTSDSVVSQLEWDPSLQISLFEESNVIHIIRSDRSTEMVSFSLINVDVQEEAGLRSDRIQADQSIITSAYLEEAHAALSQKPYLCGMKQEKCSKMSIEKASSLSPMRWSSERASMNSLEDRERTNEFSLTYFEDNCVFSTRELNGRSFASIRTTSLTDEQLQLTGIVLRFPSRRLIILVAFSQQRHQYYFHSSIEAAISIDLHWYPKRAARHMNTIDSSRSSSFFFQGKQPARHHRSYRSMMRCFNNARDGKKIVENRSIKSRCILSFILSHQFSLDAYQAARDGGGGLSLALCVC